MTEPHSPRKNDHLVEPMYAGLGVDGAPGAKRSWVGWLLWLLVVVAAAFWLISLI